MFYDYDIENDPEILFMKKHNMHMPKNDNRSYPDGAFSPPFDADGCHWEDGDPKQSGYYAIALISDSHPHGYLYSLPVEKAYYDVDKGWSRRRCSRDSLLHKKYYYEDGDGHGWLYEYYPEYWCEIPKSGILPPCCFNY